MCSQAGDRGVADKQYMVDNNGNIVDNADPSNVTPAKKNLKVL